METPPDPTPELKDIEVSSPPEDAVSALSFSPATLPQTLLLAASWDNSVRCWEIQQSGATIPRAALTTQAPLLDVCWSDDGTKVFLASCDHTVRCWDLAADRTTLVGEHAAPVRTCHTLGQTYLLTGSWDKSLLFWDTRRGPSSVGSFRLPERVFCADVDYPVAVVGTADRKMTVYQLDNTPRRIKQDDSPLKAQSRCVAIFRNKERQPAGFALGGAEGKVAVQQLNPTKPSDNFTFKCHRSAESFVDIYAVNDVAFHPVHGTLASVGSDGVCSFWDTQVRMKLSSSPAVGQSITKCAFNHDGHIFAYAVSYDWSKGHEFNSPGKKNYIFLKPCFEALLPRSAK